jgi:hypothetical protein
MGYGSSDILNVKRLSNADSIERFNTHPVEGCDPGERLIASLPNVPQRGAANRFTGLNRYRPAISIKGARRQH